MIKLFIVNRDSKSSENSLKRTLTPPEFVTYEERETSSKMEIEETVSPQQIHLVALNSSSSIINNQEYYIFQRRQIKTVITAYFVVSIIDIVWKIIFIENAEHDYECFLYDQEIVLFFFAIN